ncbi:hypothetical protein IWQ62_000828 [Dispira parvispora]|uniref:MICOS complex subunit n=1 Tax=Dispira parvispora TaxID=1520584 RepID=A0A9W8E5M0_9FUNG|nr:hypothetical protein IWQ62_000828 [Dispira parvispora]
MTSDSHPNDVVPNPKKLDIYDKEEPQPLPVYGPSRLQLAIKEARLKAERAASLAVTHKNIAVDRWIEFERHTGSVIRNTIPREERLFPGAIYVAVAGLAGSIFSRKRNFLVRWTTPLVFAAASSFYFLPGTARTLSQNIYGAYRDPATEQQAREVFGKLTGLGDRFNNNIERTVHDARQNLVESVRTLESPASNEPKK